MQIKSPASPQLSRGTDGLRQFTRMLPHWTESAPDTSGNESESLFSLG